jgi:hypothetical protein
MEKQPGSVFMSQYFIAPLSLLGSAISTLLPEKKGFPRNEGSL